MDSGINSAQVKEFKSRIRVLLNSSLPVVPPNTYILLFFTIAEWREKLPLSSIGNNSQLSLPN